MVFLPILETRDTLNVLPHGDVHTEVGGHCNGNYKLLLRGVNKNQEVDDDPDGDHTRDDSRESVWN